MIGKKQIVWLLIFLFVVFIGLMTIGGATTPEPVDPNAKQEVTDVDAFVMAKQKIREALDVPIDIDIDLPFADYEFATVEGNTDLFNIRSYFDAKDGDTEIRVQWSMIIEYQGGDTHDVSNWVVNQLLIDGGDKTHLLQ